MSLDVGDYYYASDQIYYFFWDIFCSKWIEISKKESISITLNEILLDFKPILNIILNFEN